MSLWLLLVAAVAGISILLFVSRRRGGPPTEEAGDAGLAIMEFGRAFPEEPVRDIVMTADGKSAFLRLADGKMGFIHAMGRHYVTHLIPPGGVEVEGPTGECGLVVRFRQSSFRGGTFVFARPEEAAEVAVWLLDGFALAAERPDDR